MAQIKIFVGDVTEDLASHAKKHDPSAKLLTRLSKNFLEPGTYYTSIGDLEDLSQFSNFLRQADEIYYCQPAHWSDKKIKTWTEDYLSVFACNHNKKIFGYDSTQYEKVKKMLSLQDSRKSSDPQIWIAGCSISHGVGILENQKYGKLIANTLDMPVSFLTRSGTSIRWACSQLLRSDIRTNDIVFWGVTSPTRIYCWDEENSDIRHCTATLFTKPSNKSLQKLIRKEYFTSEHVVFESIESIAMVENVMNAIGAHLFIGIMLPGLEKYLTPKKNIINFAGIYGRDSNDMFLDLGSDNRHPGPLMHQSYHDTFIKMYKNKGEVYKPR